MFKSLSVLSLLLFIILGLELQKDLDDLNEKVEQVKEEDHGMLGYIALAVHFASLNDHLGVVDNVHASDEEGKQKVAKAMDAAAVSRNPASEIVNHHA